jgi:spermidine/putrescine transport system ATP-binding protein
LAEISIELRNVTKIFDGDFVAVNNVNLSIEKGEFFSLLGPSGCGKTTILRMISGLEEPTKGEVILNGRVINDLPPNKREVNTVFQNYALFPHLTVFENIAFSLRIKRKSEAEIKKKVMDMIDLMRLNGHENKKPSQLSGGQKQRVAIARALVNEPSVLLLDEPLAALDAKLRQHMLIELDNIHDEVGITFIYVTHDQSEALSISDHLAVMNEGKIIQVGTPVQVYESPANLFVANFIGETNFIQGIVEKVEDNYILLKTEKLDEIWCYRDFEVKIGEKINVSIRPEKLKITREKPSEEVLKNSFVNVFKGIVSERIYLGTHSNYIVSIDQGYQMKVYRQHIRYLLDENIIDWNDEVYVWWFADDSYLIKD